MKEIVVTAATVEEAVNKGCAQLGVEREDSQFEIISLPKKGFLGFGAAGAKVRVFVEEELDVAALVKEAIAEAAEPAEKPAKKAEKKVEKKPAKKAEKVEKPAPTQEIIETLKEDKEPITAEQLSEKNQAKLALAKEYLLQMLTNLGCDAHLVETVYEDGVVLVIEGSGLGTVIGRRGETLDAIQYLTGLVANRGDDSYYRITVDCQGYRDKRVITLQNLAVRMATKAVKTGRSTRLEPMNPFERRVIHAAVSTVEGAQSTSFGEEPNRRVVISSKNRPPRDERRGGRGGRNDRGGRGGRNDRGDRRNSRPRQERAAAPAAPTRPARSDFDELGDLGGGLYGKIEL